MPAAASVPGVTIWDEIYRIEGPDGEVRLNCVATTARRYNFRSWLRRRVEGAGSSAFDVRRRAASLGRLLLSLRGGEHARHRLGMTLAARLVRFLRTWHGSNGGAVRASALVGLKSKKSGSTGGGPADPLAVVGCLRSVGARGLGGKKNEQP